MRTEIEALRQALPDPFRYSQELERFFELEQAQALTRHGPQSAEELLRFIESEAEPARVRVATLLLSRLDPAFFHRRFLTWLALADREMVEAVEPGIWRFRVEANVLAKDIVALASAGRPHALLLLQRPAVRAAKLELISFARQDLEPLSVYALYALEHALDASDRELLEDLRDHSRVARVRELAGELVSKLPAGSAP